MIENQSDNIDNKENDVSNQDNAPEDSSSQEDQITENDELSSQKTEEINTEELKNTISNNDARLEQLEKEHETLKNQYVRISADFDNFRKRQSRDQDDIVLLIFYKPFLRYQHQHLLKLQVFDKNQPLNNAQVKIWNLYIFRSIFL